MNEKDITERDIGSRFKLIFDVAYDQPPAPHRDNAQIVRTRNVLAMYGEQSRTVPTIPLQSSYQDENVTDLDDQSIFNPPHIVVMCIPVEPLRQYSGQTGFEHTVRPLQSALYREAA